MNGTDGYMYKILFAKKLTAAICIQMSNDTCGCVDMFRSHFSWMD